MKKRISIVLGVILIVLLVGARIYLSSRMAANQVAQRLSAMLGTRVEVGDVDIPFFGQMSLEDVQIYPTGEQSSGKPWLTIPRGKMDLGALGILSGKMPERMTLSEAEIELTFGPEGELLTRLPELGDEGGPMPEIEFQNSTVILAQQGRRPMIARGADVLFHNTPEGIAGAGVINSPDWGQWEVELKHLTEEDRLSLLLKTDRAHLTQKQLETIPFVGDDVWEQVQAEGVTAATVAVDILLERDEVNYRVELDLAGADLTVAAVDLNAKESTGRIIVDDNVVELRDLQARTAQGKIKTSGDLDFRTEVSNMKFDVAMEQVALEELPPSWGLPSDLAGRISGRAEMQVVVDGKVVKTTGQGSGVINQAQLGALLFPAPIPLKLHADGARFQFNPEISTMMSVFPARLFPFGG